MRLSSATQEDGGRQGQAGQAGEGRLFSLRQAEKPHTWPQRCVEAELRVQRALPASLVGAPPSAEHLTGPW